VNCRKENKQTTNEIDKLSVEDSSEIAGCNLVITEERHWLWQTTRY
jgi:hypothetical protein